MVQKLQSCVMILVERMTIFMHTEQLEYFIAIAEAMSFTEASYDLMVSQSSLSKQIGKLEEELGARLFHRGKRQLEMTDAGKEFLPYARKALSEYRNIKQELLKYSPGGTIRIGSIDHMGKVGLTAPIASFLENFPENSIHIDIERGYSLQVVESLLSGKTDICFTARIADRARGTSNLDCFDLDGFYCRTLVHDEYHVIVPSAHSLADRELVNWEDLKDEKLLLLDRQSSLNGQIRECFRFRGITPHISFECNQTDALLRMVSEGFGITFLSGRVASTVYDVKKIRLQNSLSRDTLMIVPKSQMNRKGLICRFARHVESYYLQGNEFVAT